jgi:hypothetical protein
MMTRSDPRQRRRTQVATVAGVFGLALLGSCSCRAGNAVAPAATTALPATTRGLVVAGPTAPGDPSGPTTGSGPSSGPSSSPGAPATVDVPNVAPPTRAPDVSADEVRNAYKQAFEDECRRIFSIAPDGVLHDPDDEQGNYRVEDCLDLLDVDQAEGYLTVAEARQGGVDDAALAASSLGGATKLCASNGQCWEYSG